MSAALPRYIATYYETLARLAQQGARSEGALRVAFQTLLEEAGRGRSLTLVAEQRETLANRRAIRFDGELRDPFRIRRGVWEAKDSDDNLEEAIRQKLAAGYPTQNTLFENTRHAVLFQDGARVLDHVDLSNPTELLRLLNQFLDYSPALIEKFHEAVATFRREIPQLAAGLSEILEREKRDNRRFQQAMEEFLALCRAALNPKTSLDEVEDMLKQHLLTERIFRSVFANPDFVRRNAIARELEKVIDALTSRAFSRDAFTSRLDYFYRAIEETARTIDDYREKQGFLHAVYEQFFQGYSTDTADTHGIVYTPAPIVRWMVASVEQILQKEFGTSLGARGVQVLDPCVGTGTFMLELLAALPPSALPHKYAHELHCNEVLLLPYYIAAQNIEHEYFERTGEYRPFEGICFADTLGLGPNRQLDIFAPENSARIQRQEAAPLFVILGNPPYNVGQKNENDNNKNAQYPQGVDKRIRETYVRSSRATLNTKLYDQYVRFFRWATDRLHGEDGIIAFVTNNSFLNQLAFDGMRQELLKEFTTIYTLDLGGNVRQNPKLSGTTHNVFGIQVGVAITFLIRRRAGQPQGEPAHLFYARVGETWRKEEKYEFLDNSRDYTTIPWQSLTPDARGTWLTEGLEADFETFLPIGSKAAKATLAGARETLFKTYSLGVATNRDTWVYDFNPRPLGERIEQFIEFYDEQLIRWQHRKDKTVDLDSFLTHDDTKIKWSRNLKRTLNRGISREFSEQAIRQVMYRPFTRKSLYFADLLVDERGTNHLFFPTPATEAENRMIVVSDHGHRSNFSVLMTNTIADLHLLASTDGFQCFPLYTYDEDGGNRQENITDAALARFRARYAAGGKAGGDTGNGDGDENGNEDGNGDGNGDGETQAFASLHGTDSSLSGVVPSSDDVVPRRSLSTTYHLPPTKQDIFHYTYALLHHPDYRTRYAENLKRDLPHIPLVPVEDFAAFVAIGRALAALHVDYLSAPEYPLRHVENRAVPWTWRVEKMRLAPDKRSLRLNDALTLADIPPEAFAYRLGSRSALEWLIEQYQVKRDKRSNLLSDPNDPDDPEAIARLIKQVVTVSVETVRLVAALPGLDNAP